MNIIYELTRNAFIPFVGDRGTLQKVIPAIQRIQSKKSLPNYVFKMNPKNGSFNTVSSKQLGDINVNNISNYWHFITDHRDLLDKYKKLGKSLRLIPIS